MGEAGKLRFGEQHPTMMRLKKFVADMPKDIVVQAEEHLRKESADGDRESQLQMRVMKRWRTSAAIEIEEFLFLCWYLRDFAASLKDTP